MQMKPHISTWTHCFHIGWIEVLNIKIITTNRII